MSLNKKELGKFIVSGGLAVATDWGSYLLYSMVVNYNISKALSYISGSIVAYLLNKYWTFTQLEKSKSEVIRFIILYLFSFGMNVISNKLLIQFTIGFEYSIQLSLFIATGISTVINFIGQKFWVFKS